MIGAKSRHNAARKGKEAIRPRPLVRKNGRKISQRQPGLIQPLTSQLAWSGLCSFRVVLNSRYPSLRSPPATCLSFLPSRPDLSHTYAVSTFTSSRSSW